MPESRLAKARASLPEGYQFGEGKWTPAQVIAARDVERRTSGWATLQIQPGRYHFTDPTDGRGYYVDIDTSRLTRRYDQDYDPAMECAMINELCWGKRAR